MRYLKYAALLGGLLFAAGTAHAQVSMGVGIGPVYGPAPACAYGYYSYYPYACAPNGYYGPDWFVGGVFIGAGPWYHGFYGPRFDGRGYYGRGYYGHLGYGKRSVYGGSYRGAPGRGNVGGGYHGNVAGGFHGGSSFHGGGGRFHGGGGSHR
jgi:hypothetical protein